VTKRTKTAFDRDVDRDMRGPEYRAAYKLARARIDAIDSLVRDLDGARAAQDVSKAELARRMGVTPEVIRRLFSADSPNPTMKTVVGAAQALGHRIAIEPDPRPRPTRKRPRTVA